MKAFGLFGVLSLAILLMLGVSGCMGIQSDKVIKEEILAYLGEKYNGQEFEVIGLERGYSYTLHCYPKGGDPEADRVKAYLSTKEAGVEGRYFSDNYFGILIREDVEAEVLAVISDLSLPMKVYYTSYTFSSYNNIFDGTKTYADLKQEDFPYLDVSIAVFADGLNQSEKEDYAMQIFDKLEDHGQNWFLNVLFYPHEAFGRITRTNSNELAEQYADEYAIFTKIINRKEED